MSAFVCPVCGLPLERDGGSLKCSAGHCYDVASGGAGYVNLLAPNKHHSSEPGDGKEMVAARTLFLDTGAYAPLRDEVTRLAAQTSAPGLALDVCCGEGYYTRAVAETCPDRIVAAFDLSRPAVKKAAKRCAGLGNVAFAVAGGTEMPLADSSVAFAAELFAPLFAAETARVVMPGGRFLFVSPGERHLYGLKRAIYDEPRLNEEKVPELPGFTLASSSRLTFDFSLDSAETVSALFAMTPYFWRSSPETSERAKALNRLDTEADFILRVYERDR